MATERSYSEYAVEIDGYGFACGVSRPPFMLSVCDTPEAMDTIGEADRITERVVSAYQTLGIDVSGRVFRRERIVTVTTGDWQ
ncbi:hypothetical protein ABW16_21490 [Mycolicibacter heraklionensis]|uniref:Uncharacterized protein n=1 Tax=Mycolicibacter heraklionensis TaxID=512402 RepID=A0ABR5FA85_9MYCO|nr:hypothetical protein [Mycolicibacter heraklionensis]KLO25889.1 hypothetical protein ABW16_21490 [Mycolicibacter heraklionensis]